MPQKTLKQLKADVTKAEEVLSTKRRALLEGVHAARQAGRSYQSIADELEVGRSRAQALANDACKVIVRANVD